MTDNLPSRRVGPAMSTRPLADQTTESLCFALGYITARPVSANQFGGFCALAEELMARGAWQRAVAALPPGMRRAIDMLYLAHKGQRVSAGLASERAARQQTSPGDNSYPTNTGNAGQPPTG